MKMRLEARMAQGRRAVVAPSCAPAAAHQLDVGRFAEDDSGLKPLSPQHARNAAQRAAGAVAGETSRVAAIEVGEDLTGGRGLRESLRWLESRKVRRDLHC
jgi:hypothetical protein